MTILIFTTTEVIHMGDNDVISSCRIYASCFLATV